jgi:outer membrane protein
MLGQQVMLSPRIVATWLDESYVDYQYGVRANEATSERQAYIGDSTINIELGLRTAYLFSRQSSIFIDASIISLGDEIKDSPLVDSSTENRVMFAYLYKF